MNCEKQCMDKRYSAFLCDVREQKHRTIQAFASEVNGSSS